MKTVLIVTALCLALLPACSSPQKKAAQKKQQEAYRNFYKSTEASTVAIDKYENARNKTKAANRKVAKKEKSSQEKLVIPTGGDLEAKDRKGKTILMYAAEKGKLETVKRLIKKGADVNAERTYSYTSSGRKLTFQKGTFTSLLFAAENGHLEIVKYLIANGAKIKLLNNGGLNAAASKGHLEIVKVLIAKGAEVNKHLYQSTPLMGASYGGHNEIIKYLLTKEADINARNKAGKTGLMFASGRGLYETVALLIANGADVNMKIDAGLDEAEYGKTALNFAGENGHDKIVKFLKTKGGTRRK
jgi:ankyrin repeat protein